MTTEDNAIKDLERFIFNNEDLERLESIVDQFNIFLSLGIINQEIKHSNFLGWLLDPSETHNLSEAFLSSFLKQVTFIDSSESPEVNIFSIDTMDLSNSQVYREWNHIDLLIVDEYNRFVCVIENKIDSKEHSNQLAKYKEKVEAHYPSVGENSYKKIYVYLTVNGEEPEKDKEYIPISYGEVSTLITKLLKGKGNQLNEEVRLVIDHYNEMLKRYIMEESDVQELCVKLYKKHRKALDLIFNYKPDIYLDIREALEEIIDEDDRLIKDHCSKSYIRFIPKELDLLPKEGFNWVPSKRIVLFEFKNKAKSTDLYLIIGPGPSEIRESLYEFTKPAKVFNVNSKSLSKVWASVFKLEISKVSKLEDKEKEEIKEELKTKIDQFFERDYPKIKEVWIDYLTEKSYS